MLTFVGCIVPVPSHRRTLTSPCANLSAWSSTGLHIKRDVSTNWFVKMVAILRSFQTMNPVSIKYCQGTVSALLRLTYTEGFSANTVHIYHVSRGSSFSSSISLFAKWPLLHSSYSIARYRVMMLRYPWSTELAGQGRTFFRSCRWKPVSLQVWVLPA